MGPYAGLDLHKKILDNTVSGRDQDHLSVAHLSYPGAIADRSTYLLDETKPNPLDALTEIAFRLDDLGAGYIVLPCNTAHHQRCFGDLRRRMKETGRKAQMVSIIEETAAHIASSKQGVRRVGVLCSLATFRFDLYSDALRDQSLEPVMPDADVEEEIINQVIFHPQWGVKAQSKPIHPEATRNLMLGVTHLQEKGAEAVILGCTEFPLVVTDGEAGGLPAFDPTQILARRLVELAAPDKLKPLV